VGFDGGEATPADQVAPKSGGFLKGLMRRKIGAGD